jgi:transposase
MRVKPLYDETFRREALALLQRTDRSLPQVARDLGLVPQTLRNWYNASMVKKEPKRATGQPAKLPVSDPTAESSEAKVARLERENAYLRKENEDLKVDRAILKKAAAFFAKESE